MKLPQTLNYSTALVPGEQRSRVREVLYWVTRFMGPRELAARFREPQPRRLTLDCPGPSPIPIHDGPGCAPAARSDPSRPGPFLATSGRKVFRRTATGMRLPAGDTEIEAD
jgi:hypothetical protein